MPLPLYKLENWTLKDNFGSRPYRHYVIAAHTPDEAIEIAREDSKKESWHKGGLIHCFHIGTSLVDAPRIIWPRDWFMK